MEGKGREGGIGGNLKREEGEGPVECRGRREWGCTTHIGLLYGRYSTNFGSIVHGCELNPDLRVLRRVFEKQILQRQYHI